MTRRSQIDADLQVLEVARRLGVTVRGGLQAAIQDAVEAKVESWMAASGFEPSTLEEVHWFTQNKIRLQIRRVEDDEDIPRIGREYATEVPTLGIQLELEFGRSDTEAFLMRRQSDRRSGRYVAVIDARGERLNRAWYAERHEASHLLVEDPSTDHIWRRSGDPAPIERVVDAVAARVGFWPALVRPVVHEVRHTVGSGLLDALDGCRDELAPDASFEASLRSFALHLGVPVLLIYVAHGTRKAEAHLGSAAASYRLRVRTRVPSPSALANGLFLPANFSIPEHSVIHTAFELGPTQTLHQDDRLGRWQDSSGRSRPDVPVHVEARGRWAAITFR